MTLLRSVTTLLGLVTFYAYTTSHATKMLLISYAFAINNLQPCIHGKCNSDQLTEIETNLSECRSGD
jgi:hypothetical protein